MRSATAGNRRLLAKTCLACNQLKQGDDFSAATVYKDKGSYKSSYCRACVTLNAGLHQEKYQTTTDKTSHKRHLQWDLRDRAILTMLCRLGWHDEDIAIFLNRSYYGVASQKRKLGLYRTTNKESNNGK